MEHTGLSIYTWYLDKESYVNSFAHLCDTDWNTLVPDGSRTDQTTLIYSGT